MVSHLTFGANENTVIKCFLNIGTETSHNVLVHFSRFHNKYLPFHYKYRLIVNTSFDMTELWIMTYECVLYPGTLPNQLVCSYDR